jgi:hypothetical protein
MNKKKLSRPDSVLRLSLMLTAKSGVGKFAYVGVFFKPITLL